MSFPELKNISTFTSVFHTDSNLNQFAQAATKNFVDKKAYPELAHLADELKLFNQELFDIREGCSVITSGSTEAIFLAVYRAREKHAKAVRTPNLVVGANAHSSWRRAADFLRVNVQTVQILPNGTIDPVDFESKLDEDTILAVGTLGTTELGMVDDTDSLNHLCSLHGVDLHLDAAIGGYLVPFSKAPANFTFSKLSSLESVNISGHKFGQALLGAGIALFRDHEVAERISYPLSYLSSGSNRIEQMLLSMSSLGPVSWAFNISRLGLNGYQEIFDSLMQTKTVLTQALEDFGFETISGDEACAQLFITAPEIRNLHSFLAQKGWIQSVYKPYGPDKEGIRIVIKKGQEHLLLSELLTDLHMYKNVGTSKEFASHTFQGDMI